MTVHKKAKEAGRGILALQAIAHQKWPESIKPEKRRWNKAWYEPFDDMSRLTPVGVVS